MTNYQQPFDEINLYQSKMIHNEEDEGWEYRRDSFNRRTYHHQEITKEEKTNKQIDGFVDSILANQNLKYKTKEVSQYITKLEESLKKLLLIKPFLKDLNSMELQNEIMKLESEINNLQVLDNQNEIEKFIIDHTNRNIEKNMNGLRIDSEKLNIELNRPLKQFDLEKNTLPIEITFTNQILPFVRSILNESKEIDLYSLSKELWISLKKISQQFDQNFLAGLGLTETDNNKSQNDNNEDQKKKSEIEKEKKEEDEKEEKKEDENEWKKENENEKGVEIKIEKEKKEIGEKEKEKEKDKEENKVKSNQMINKFRISTKQTYQTTILNQQKKIELIENLVSDLEILNENPGLGEITQKYLTKLLEFYWNIEINNENTQLLQNDEELIVKFNPDLHQKINPNEGGRFHLLIPGLEQNGKIIMKTLGYFQ
ncbi:neurofilament triplet m protein-like protein [Anaeramoeba flamelloides]|uniref:Neurofilament triplet m protein-like protein n=1 Tax=Anaeramoeba flamelloides TaxID=1746091 RepID=A0AAV8A1A9_9EUKA|nr:neurofilament triplet m protein-like protein [Anaeramoeba flamelloides]